MRGHVLGRTRLRQRRSACCFDQFRPLQTKLAGDLRWKQEKTYVVQVEGEISDDALAQLRMRGVKLNDGMTFAGGSRTCVWTSLKTAPGACRSADPLSQGDSASELAGNFTIREGSAIVRYRLTHDRGASDHLPTLRLIRWSVGPWTAAGLRAGESRPLIRPVQDSLKYLYRPAASRASRR